MDEVDKIIIHSLRQIGCNIDDDAFSLTSFTPELLVRAVSACLHEIKPSTVVPKVLPEGMTQRFAVASALAETCAAVGYRSEIGYQTFLYPNVVDARKLFMFLIEILPKESRETVESSLEADGDLAMLEREIRRNMQQSLQAPWVPPYCRQRSGNGRYSAIAQYVEFKPQLNLNIPSKDTTDHGNAMQYLAPNIFQQMATGDFNITSSVLHKNDMDLYAEQQQMLGASDDKYAFTRPISLALTGVAVNKTQSNLPNENSKPSISKTPMQCLSDQVNELKSEHDELNAARKLHNCNISELKSKQATLQTNIVELRKAIKMHERTCVVLADPAQNVEKLEAMIDTAQDKRRALEEQWQNYRVPLEQRMQILQHEKSANAAAKNTMDFRELIVQLEHSMRDKTAAHAKLNAELKKPNRAASATRKEYTRRIMEFIGNIRKQRNDIYKVLDDTRDLQKQINTVSAQLQRQFNYTDDLLFKSAKNDAHARKAYKFLAALHAACNELVELVSQTGNVTKEIRDLEEHIDREKIKNIAVNLEKISFDIRNFENVVKTVQSKIHEVENRITEA